MPPGGFFWRQPKEATAPTLCALIGFLSMHCANALGESAYGGAGAAAHHPELPMVTSDAVVTGAISLKLKAQAAFHAASGDWSGGLRGLLHGRRRPQNYSACPSCSMISCSRATGETRCSGHCKCSRKLFTCRTNSAPAGA